MEPDARADVDPRADGWRGVAPTLALLAEARPALAAATGAPACYSWFLRFDPQVRETYGAGGLVEGSEGAATWHRLAAAGDEVGLHVHPFRRAPDGRFLQDFADRDWVEHCIRVSFAAFEAVFDRRCRSFRFGDHWLSQAIVDDLETLGVRQDLTIEPGRRGCTIPPTETFTGHFPDYRWAPRHPYRPSRRSFLQPADPSDTALRHIPISTGPPTPRTAGRAPRPETTSPSRADFAVEPDPAPLDPHQGVGVVTVSWRTRATRAVEIRVDAPDGTLFARGRAAGRARTGPWARHGTTFFLQDATHRVPTAAAATLASAVVRGRGEPRPDPATVALEERYWLRGDAQALDVSLPPAHFAAILDDCLERPDTVHLAAVLRSDAAIDPARREHLRANLHRLAGHPEAERLRFVRPETLIDMVEA